MNRSRSDRPPFLILRIVLVAALVQLGLATVVYVIALTVSWQGGQSGPTAAGALAGIICALAALLFVTVFHFGRETMILPVEDAQAFLRHLGGQLEAMGYAVSLPAEDRLVGRPAFHAFLFGGPIEARLGSLRAELQGPKVYLEALRRRLRLHTHVEQVPHALAAVRQRQEGPLLREVQIKIQVPGELVPAVYREVASVLAHEGAEIRCELCIHASGGIGVRDKVLESRIHDWLKEQQVPVEIHKEPLASAAKPTPVADHPLAAAV